MAAVAINIIKSRAFRFVALPVAVVLGITGYLIETALVEKKTPVIEKSINEMREERLLRELNNPKKATDNSTPYHSTIFEMNKSSQLNNNNNKMD
jgi:hypothetical protein